ncbi:hypothetical protein NDU88_006401 [Pleurodeles waltl]|uniref:Uncharacterized protein n=1 Tax=Pleurodeles waltl TaxID=8319 RepID=A0AAV7SPG6_PLEWA|nr:hypothetical protein NDU88_006401 [Pleurodeles waltl]
MQHLPGGRVLYVMPGKAPVGPESRPGVPPPLGRAGRVRVLCFAARAAGTTQGGRGRRSLQRPPGLRGPLAQPDKSCRRQESPGRSAPVPAGRARLPRLARARRGRAPATSELVLGSLLPTSRSRQDGKPARFRGAIQMIRRTRAERPVSGGALKDILRQALDGAVAQASVPAAIFPGVPDKPPYPALSGSLRP